jgi:hypothetical protein
MAAAAVWLAGVGVLHAMMGITVPSLFSVAPLIVATVADERRTAVFAGAAAALTIATGLVARHHPRSTPRCRSPVLGSDWPGWRQWFKLGQVREKLGTAAGAGSSFAAPVAAGEESSPGDGL